MPCGRMNGRQKGRSIISQQIHYFVYNEQVTFNTIFMKEEKYERKSQADRDTE